MIKPVHQISCNINKFLYEKDNGESISALIVSLSMAIKRQSRTYEDYLQNRKDTITRLMEITSISEDELKSVLHVFKRIEEVA